MQNVPLSLRINQPRRQESPFMPLPTHPSSLETKIAERVNSAPFVCSISPQSSPRGIYPATSEGNFRGKFIPVMPRSWNISACAVIVCLTCKPPLCLGWECSCELPPRTASKVSKDLQSVTRSGIKISQKTVRRHAGGLRRWGLGVSLSFCRRLSVELSEKAAESFCGSWSVCPQCGQTWANPLLCCSCPVLPFLALSTNLRTNFSDGVQVNWAKRGENSWGKHRT